MINIGWKSTCRKSKKGKAKDILFASDKGYQAKLAKLLSPYKYIKYVFKATVSHISHTNVIDLFVLLGLTPFWFLSGW